MVQSLKQKTILICLIGWTCGVRVLMQIEYYFHTGSFMMSSKGWDYETVQLADARYISIINGPSRGEDRIYVPPSEAERNRGFCEHLSGMQQAFSSFCPLNDAYSHHLSSLLMTSTQMIGWLSSIRNGTIRMDPKRNWKMFVRGWSTRGN